MDFSSPTDHEENQEPTSFLQHIIWLLKGFVYPLWSRPFYKQAASKSMGTALIFLLIFGILQSLATTANIAVNLSQFGREIDAAYLSGEIPDITIQNGIAAVSGSGRYIIENNRQIIALDTTGAMQEIDTGFYSEGFLLTRDELHLVNEDGYQVLPLSDLNKTFGNPIVLDADSVTGLWSSFALVIDIIVLVGGALFYSLGRFFYLALLGLLVWGAVSITNKNVGFAKILITGIYANVPTTYLMIIIRNLGLSFFGLRGMILFVIWGIAIAYVIKAENTGPIPDDMTGLV